MCVSGVSGTSPFSNSCLQTFIQTNVKIYFLVMLINSKLGECTVSCYISPPSIHALPMHPCAGIKLYKYDTLDVILHMMAFMLFVQLFHGCLHALFLVFW